MTYAIVRELDGYYIKTGINESELDYANGLRNKKKNRFKSYSAALKRMNLIFKPLNEEYNDGKSDTMYEQYTEKVSVEEVYEDEEVTEGDDEEEVDEQEKFVLNVPDDGGDEDMGDEELDMDMEDEGEIAMESLKKRIGTLLESYTEKKSPEKYIKSRLKKNKLNSLIEKHSSSVEQELSVKKYIKENKNTSINGKNKNGSLVLTNGDKKILINKSGVVK